MRIVQTRTPEGVRTDYYIVEVIEHIPRQTQLSLEDDPREVREEDQDEDGSISDDGMAEEDRR
jgi:hypothetical protein